jgi:uncharacterized membrane protein
MRRTSALDRAIDLIPWLLAAVFGAIAVHLVLLLALPGFAPASAWRRLALKTPIGEVALLPRAAPTTRPLFSDPYAALALCRFDTTRGPLRLRAQADADHPFAVSVRLADGTIIFSANDRQTPKGRFNIRILSQAQADAEDFARDHSEQEEPPEQKPSAPAQDAPDADELRLISPAKSGFALFRALSLREGDYDAAAAALASVSCALEKPAR